MKQKLCFLTALLITMVGLMLPATASPTAPGANGLGLIDAHYACASVLAVSPGADQPAIEAKLSPSDVPLASNGFNALLTGYQGTYSRAPYSAPAVAKTGRLIDYSP